MAERVLQATATIAAGTPQATPSTVALPFDGWEIEAIDLDVPPGPGGTMGFVLANNGVPWIPRSPGEWLVWDDRRERFPTSGYPSASGWQVIGYNTGTYDHDVVVRFHVNPITIVAARETVPYVLTFVERDVPALPVVTL